MTSRGLEVAGTAPAIPEEGEGMHVCDEENARGHALAAMGGGVLGRAGADTHHYHHLQQQQPHTTEGSAHDAGSQHMKKRKSFDFNLVSEKMKRCRIAVTPGELRLRKDLEEYNRSSRQQMQNGMGHSGVRVSRTADPLMVQVHFETPGAAEGRGPLTIMSAAGGTTSALSGSTSSSAPHIPVVNQHIHGHLPSGGCAGHGPNLFTVKVPRFYPHDPPAVIVLDASFHGRVPFVEPNGEVTHPLLKKDWSSVMTLRDVVGALRYVFECGTPATQQPFDVGMQM